jgi:hypothetical protein
MAAAGWLFPEEGEPPAAARRASAAARASLTCREGSRGRSREREEGKREGAK